MRRAVGIFAAAVLLASCVAHEKAGDSAAAVGDWRSAYHSYREAVEREPERPDLREKFARAKHEAFLDATRRAQSCGQQLQWQCAVNEADFALLLNPGDPQMSSFRADAARSLARANLSESHQRALARDWNGAAQLLDAAAQTTDAQLLQEVRGARLQLAEMVAADAEGLRQQRRYGEAVELLTLAVRLDPNRSAQLQMARQENEQYLDQEHERLAREGDGALEQRDFARAQERYQAAAQLRPNGRAAPMVQYANALVRGDEAMRQQNFPAAEDAYRQAAATGMDRQGYAAERLQAVQLRPYAIRIRSLLVMPTRPDGYSPWTGTPDGLFMHLTRELQRRMGNREGDAARYALVRAAEQVPLANRPSLAIIATLPDGNRLMTPEKRALHAQYDARFAVVSNFFDERFITFRVVHRDPSGEVDVGMIDVPLRQLVELRGGSFSGGGVAELSLQVEPFDGRPEMAVVGMDVLGAAPGQPYVAPQGPVVPASRFPKPVVVPVGGGAPTISLRSASVGAGVRDFQREPDEAAGPDLVLELFQGDRQLYRSPVIVDRLVATWAPLAHEAVVDPNRELVVKIWDEDPNGSDLIFSGKVPPAVLSTGRFSARSPRGSEIRMEFTPPSSHAASAVHR